MRGLRRDFFALMEAWRHGGCRISIEIIEKESHHRVATGGNAEALLFGAWKAKPASSSLQLIFLDQKRKKRKHLGYTSTEE